MALATQPQLAHLIHAFQTALAQEQLARWQQIDLAVQIADAFPDHGLAQLAIATGLSHSTVARYVVIGRTFPATVRQPYLALSYSHFRNALTAAHKHPKTLGVDPLWWLGRALREGWSTEELSYHANHDLSSIADAPNTPDPREQTQRITHLIREGNHVQTTLQTTIQEYNREYAPFTGVCLGLIVEAYTAS